MKTNMATVFPCPSDSNKSITIGYFEDVKNVPEIKRKIIDGTIDACVIKSKMIVDVFQVLCATNIAVVNHTNQKMVTNSLKTEVLFSLSSTKQITDALRKFGIDDKDTDILLVEIAANGDSKIEEITKQIDGTISDFNKMKGKCDENLVKKVYKVKEDELKIGSLLDAVVGRMAAKTIGIV